MDEQRQPLRGTNRRTTFARRSREQARRDQRRRDMHAAEGHAGSTPRDNPDLDPWKMGERWGELDGLLGH